MPSTTEPFRVISMDVASSNPSNSSFFRILANRSVKYITIAGRALDEESLEDMCLDFQNVLPPLPWTEDNWNSVYVTRNPSSHQLEVALSSADLPRVETIWHPRMTDFLDIEYTHYYSFLTRGCKVKGSPAPEEMVVKAARFYWEIRYMEAETRMYQILEGRGMAPKFLGHIHEAGRVIGFLLEKIPDGRNAEPADKEICRAALRRFHALGFVHGDPNKYNFIIRPDGQVLLIDFDNVKPCTDPALLEAEIASLDGQLAEMTGRGCPQIKQDSDDE
ncbi:alpha-galactosidase A [Jackrogersella minutella]|nr:alpha-galactosidase A [Jackrogersella minutella]